MRGPRRATSLSGFARKVSGFDQRATGLCEGSPEPGPTRGLPRRLRFKRGVESIEAIKSLFQDFRVAQAEPCPPLEEQIKADALGTLEFAVFQIGIVNHLTKFTRGGSRNGESLEQCLEGTILAVMSEFYVHHVVGNGLGVAGRECCENEGRGRIDKFADEPCRADAINFRTRPGEPGASLKALPIEQRPRFAGNFARRLGVSASFADDHEQLRHGFGLYDVLYAWLKQART